MKQYRQKRLFEIPKFLRLPAKQFQKFMKNIFVIAAVLFLSASAFAQTKMTDRAFAGLKGKVKSVIKSYSNFEEKDGKTVETARLKLEENYYDESGNLIKTFDNISTELNTYKFIDGAKTAKTTELESQLQGIRVGSTFNQLPETKLTTPDTRYTNKFIYEYDKKNRITKETVYLNNNKILRISTFEYDDNGNLVKDTFLNVRYAYTETHKFDNRGIEVGSIRNANAAGEKRVSNTDYSNYKFDAQGNWIKRTSIYQSKDGNSESVVKQSFYREIMYYEK